MATTYGPFNFATSGADTSAFNWLSNNGVSSNPPTSGSPNEHWKWEDLETGSTGVGPTTGQGGQGYVYTESTGGGWDVEYVMEFGTSLDASAEQWQLTFYTNQRGTENNTVCDVQISEGGGAFFTIATFGGDIAIGAEKIATSGSDVWVSRSVDLSQGGIYTHANTVVRLRLDCGPEADAGDPGLFYHNDYGIDTVTITGTDFVFSTEQEGFRFRNDDGSEAGASWRQGQDINDQGPKALVFRLRVLTDTSGDTPSNATTLQVRRTDEDGTQWRDV